MLDYLIFKLYDKKNMKYDLGELNMNNKIFLTAGLCCLLGLSGCARHSFDAECTGPNCQNQADYVCQATNDPSLCAEDPFVNYTATAADFREYGERTPRDRLVSQAAAGNNLVATIPPSIEDEVISYEEQLEKQLPEPVAQEATEVDTDQEKAQDDDVVFADDDLMDIDVEEETSGKTEQNNEAVEEVDEELEDPVQDWLAEEGQNLKLLLTEWSEQSGWRLIWNTNRNYVLSAGAMFRGRFADVSSALIRAFARARPAPIATFYKGNRVLVVETMEDENAYE